MLCVAKRQGKVLSKALYGVRGKWSGSSVLSHTVCLGSKTKEIPLLDF